MKARRRATGASLRFRRCKYVCTFRLAPGRGVTWGAGRPPPQSRQLRMYIHAIGAFIAMSTGAELVAARRGSSLGLGGDTGMRAGERMDRIRIKYIQIGRGAPRREGGYVGQSVGCGRAQLMCTRDEVWRRANY